LVWQAKRTSAGVLTGSTSLFSAGIAATEGAGALSAAIYGVSQTSEDLPTLSIDAKKMPNIAGNIATAQVSGQPSILTRTTDQTILNAIRATACTGYCGSLSPDEYPFASTYEGGAGAQIRGVPIREQRIQGGTLSKFYLNNNIGDGDKFKVRVDR
jgi:hypothetical protein